MNYREEIDKSYDSLRAPTLASIVASKPRGTVRGPRSNLVVSVGEAVSHLLPNIGGNIEKLGWGNRLNTGDYIGSGVEGALMATPLGRMSKGAIRSGVNKMYGNPFGAQYNPFYGTSQRGLSKIAGTAPSIAARSTLNTAARIGPRNLVYDNRPQPHYNESIMQSYFGTPF